ncbi:MAG: RnfABCDGE type electron transport complex subunit D [Candidatus Omnitrophota bacterium]
MTQNRISAPPHLHCGDSVIRMTVGAGLGFLPVALAALLAFGGRAAGLFGLSLAGAVAAEFAASRLLEKKWPAAEDIAACLMSALLYAALVPVHWGAVWIITGSVASVLIGRKVFGALGASPFHPVMTGLSFVMAVSPGLFHAGGLAFSFAHTSFSDFLLHKLPVQLGSILASGDAGCLAATSVAAILLGGAVLWMRRLVLPEIPLIYLGTLAAGARLCFGACPAQSWMGLLPTDVFVAFFILTDSVTAPLTRSAKRWLAFAAAGLVLALRPFTGALGSAVLAVLAMNAMTPWMDEWFRPRGSRSGTFGADFFRNLKSPRKEGHLS